MLCKILNGLLQTNKNVIKMWAGPLANKGDVGAGEFAVQHLFHRRCSGSGGASAPSFLVRVADSRTRCFLSAARTRFLCVTTDGDGVTGAAVTEGAAVAVGVPGVVVVVAGLDDATNGGPLTAAGDTLAETGEGLRGIPGVGIAVMLPFGAAVPTVGPPGVDGVPVVALGAVGALGLVTGVGAPLDDVVGAVARGVGLGLVGVAAGPGLAEVGPVVLDGAAGPCEVAPGVAEAVGLAVAVVGPGAAVGPGVAAGLELADGVAGLLVAEGTTGLLVATEGAAGVFVTTDGAAGVFVTTDGAAGLLVMTEGAAGLLVTADGAAGLLVTTDGAAGLLVTTEGAAGLLVTADGATGLLVTTDGAAGLLVTDGVAGLLVADGAAGLAVLAGAAALGDPVAVGTIGVGTGGKVKTGGGDGAGVVGAGGAEGADGADGAVGAVGGTGTTGAVGTGGKVKLGGVGAFDPCAGESVELGAAGEREFGGMDAGGPVVGGGPGAGATLEGGLGTVVAGATGEDGTGADGTGADGTGADGKGADGTGAEGTASGVGTRDTRGDGCPGACETVGLGAVVRLPGDTAGCKVVTLLGRGPEVGNDVTGTIDTGVPDVEGGISGVGGAGGRVGRGVQCRFDDPLLDLKDLLLADFGSFPFGAFAYLCFELFVTLLPFFDLKPPFPPFPLPFPWSLEVGAAAQSSTGRSVVGRNTVGCGVGLGAFFAMACPLTIIECILFCLRLLSRRDVSRTSADSCRSLDLVSSGKGNAANEALLMCCPFARPRTPGCSASASIGRDTTATS